MEARLRRHDERRGADGWKRETLDSLFDRLQGEVDELQVARLPGAIAEEAADAANYAMMIADVAGGLSERTVRVLQQRRAANEPTGDVPGGWPPGTLSTERLRREMPTLAAVADSVADELMADVQAGPTTEEIQRRESRFQRNKPRWRADIVSALQEIVEEGPRAGLTPELLWIVNEAAEQLRAQPTELRQAANVTRPPVTDDPAYVAFTRALAELVRLIAERDTLEAKVRELEGHG
jgi:NTP pyrophosphatase (non-canonical NTP hydrolase)